MIAYSILSQCDELLTDENGRTAFHIAANGGNVSVMKKLFEIQPLIKTNLTDYTGYSLILWSIEAKEIDMLKFLLSKSTAIDTSQGHKRLFWKLLRNSSDPFESHRDNKAKTALHWAAHSAKAEFCLELLKFDPGLIDMVDGEGNTALHLAAEAESVEVLSGSGIIFFKFVPKFLIISFYSFGRVFPKLMAD